MAIFTLNIIKRRLTDCTISLLLVFAILEKKAKNSENTHLIFHFAKIYDVLDDNGIAFSSRSYAVSWKWKHKHPREKIKADKGKDIIINKFYSSSSFLVSCLRLWKVFFIYYIYEDTIHTHSIEGYNCNAVM